MADLIIISVNQDNYEDLIKNTDRILGKEDIYYSLIIYDNTKYEAVEKGEKFYWTPGSAGYKVEMHSSEGIVSDDGGWTDIIIPNTNKKIPLVRILFLYGTGRPPTKEGEIWEDFGSTGSI